jgi:hypothetical protein
VGTPESGKSQFGTDRLYETAKWLIGIFGVGAGAVVAGIPFTNLGALRSGSAEFANAVTGLALAVGGLLVAVGGATFALTSGFIDFKKVKNSGATRFCCTNQALKYFLVTVRPDIVTDAGYADPADWWAKFVSSDETVRATAKSRLDGLLPLLQYLAVRRRLRIGILVIFVGVTAAAVGAAVFAWSLSRPTPARLSAPPGQPLPVVVRMSAQGQADTIAVRGPNCAPESVQALLLAKGGGDEDVLILPSQSCPPMRILLTPALGVIEAEPVRAG